VQARGDDISIYPQKPVWGKTEDGTRYIASKGMYCCECGFPADDSPHYIHRGLCRQCGTIPMCSIDERIEHAGYIAASALQEMALVRSIKQMAAARSALPYYPSPQVIDSILPKPIGYQSSNARAGHPQEGFSLIYSDNVHP